ncbi:MAG: hypothetical protein HY328_00345 [Chloroflexi bacterium]|nr:hypothetical protein [Chloroflexota bacterium]
MKRLPTWREMHMDTTPEAEAIQFAFYRSAPGWRKLAMMSSLNRSVRTLAMSGLRSRHPNASLEELRYLLAELLYGTEIAEKIRSVVPAAGALGNE